MVNTFYIKGGKTLNGSLDIYSAKNALLPILAASIMCPDEVTILNCCPFSDVQFMIKILQTLGVKATNQDDTLILNLSGAEFATITEEYTKKVRSSIFMLGSLLSRFKKACVAYPGGCNIGTRPIDLHLLGLKALNVAIKEEDGMIICDGSNMKCGDITLSMPSVGATENVMMASVFLKGTSTITGAAKEPEIVDLQNFLNAMGAHISGAGTNKITIEGVERLHGVTYRPISDRIVTGTYLIACAMNGGRVTLTNAYPQHVSALVKILKHSNCDFKLKPHEITVKAAGRPHAIKFLATQPYPGFATDLQSPFLTLQTIAKGTSVIEENLYETRFKIVPELLKMGAVVSMKDRIATVTGVEHLTGAEVIAPDLRSGAGLVIAGLHADGDTTICDIENIERGYLNMDTDLQRLGADIQRRIIS